MSLMRSAFAISFAVMTFVLLLPPSFAHAEEFLANASYNGELRLNDEKGRSSVVEDRIVQLELTAPSFFKSPRRRWNDEQVFRIRTQARTYEFRIPAPLIKSAGEFSVRADYAEQTAHIRSFPNRYDHSRNTGAKVITCTYPVVLPQVVTSFSNGQMTTSVVLVTHYYSGTQSVVLQEDRWTETLKVEVYNDLGSAEFQTEPKRRAADTILQYLTGCR